MEWISNSVREEVSSFIDEPAGLRARLLVVRGLSGMGKSDTTKFFLSRLAVEDWLIGNLDFSRSDLPFWEWPTLFLISLWKKQTKFFRNFLQTFPDCHQSEIVKLLNSESDGNQDVQQLIGELFHQFLAVFPAPGKRVFVFENLHLADRFQFKQLLQFIRTYSYAGICFFLTTEENNRSDELPVADKEILLNRMSVQEIEKLVQQHSGTSALNARLLTNHSYIKTAGTPGKIRLLLEGVFCDLISGAGDDYLDVAGLQRIRINGEWQEVVKQFLQSRPEAEQVLAGVFAHISTPLSRRDAELLSKLTGADKNCVERFLRAGLIREISDESGIAFYMGRNELRKWIKCFIPLADLKPILRAFSEKKHHRHYLLSHLLYELDCVQPAIQKAGEEAQWLKARGRLTEAADRLYFLTRLSHVNPQLVPDRNAILWELGCIYLNLGAHENAFEILRTLRDTYTGTDQFTPEKKQALWLETGLKMAEALIAMDAYQEARYILREIKVKDFAGDDVKGTAYRLFGDLERNLAHLDLSRQYYRLALDCLINSRNTEEILRVYRSLTELEAVSPEIIRQMLALFTKAENPRQYMDLLKDAAKIDLKAGNFSDALQRVWSLRRCLRVRFNPALRIQMNLLCAEIFAGLGKWRLAVSHLNNLQQQPALAYRPRLQVNVCIQLGILHKDQVYYGHSLRYFRKGLEICRLHDLQKDGNQIKLQLGHLYILSHGMMRAREYLTEARRGAEELHQFDIILQCNLYLAYYFLRQNKTGEAKRYLREARKWVDPGQRNQDFLNYLFYLAFYLQSAGEYEKAMRVIKKMAQVADNSPRYFLFSQYLEARNLFLKGVRKQASNLAEKVLSSAEKQQVHQIYYLMQCDRVYLGGDAAGKTEYIAGAADTIKELASRIDDEILRVQFLEARFHEEILRFDREAV